MALNLAKVSSMNLVNGSNFRRLRALTLQFQVWLLDDLNADIRVLISVMSASLLSRLETADISADRMPLFDELRTTTLDCPDRIGPFLHIIKPAFCDRLRSLRGLAYMCAFDYVCANPSMAEHFTSAYLAALLHHEADISLHALSYLPEFIKVCQ